MNQYIPQRIRSIVKSRLDFVGLWGLGGLNIGEFRATCKKKDTKIEESERTSEADGVVLGLFRRCRRRR